MARQIVLLTASALVLAPPGVAGAYPTCGGSTFSTCASIAINRLLKRDGNVRVRMERTGEAALAYTREGAPLGLIEQWRLPEEDGSEAKLSLEARVKATQWRDGEDASGEVRKNGTRREKGGPAVAQLEADRRDVVLVPRRRTPEFVELNLSKGRKDDVAANDDDKESGDKKDRAACTNDVGRGAEAKGSVLCESVVVPEPSSFILLASALAGLSAMRWRRRQQ